MKRDNGIIYGIIELLTYRIDVTDFLGFAMFVAVNALLLFILAFKVSLLRLKLKISLGDGGNSTLNNAMRAHGNGLEQFPIFALLLLTLTLLGTSQLIIAIFGVSFTAARLFHAYGMLEISFPARRIGATATYILQLAAITAVVIQCVL